MPYMKQFRRTPVGEFYRQSCSREGCPQSLHLRSSTCMKAAPKSQFPKPGTDSVSSVLHEWNGGRGFFIATGRTDWVSLRGGQKHFKKTERGMKARNCPRCPDSSILHSARTGHPGQLLWWKARNRNGVARPSCHRCEHVSGMEALIGRGPYRTGTE